MNYIQEIKNTLDELTENHQIGCPLASFGHVSTNLGIKNPEKIEKTIKELKRLSFVQDISLSEKGFINIKIKKEIISDFNIFKKKENGVINIEYSSPNPTGPIHLGHCRGTLIGNILSKLFTYAGYKVTEELYLNNEGVQVENFFESVLFYINDFLKKENNCTLYYKGEYIKELAQKCIDLGIEPTKELLIDWQLESFIIVLEKMGINHDVISKESDLKKEIKEVKLLLEKKELLIKGNPKKSIDGEECWLINVEKLGINRDIDKVFIRGNGIPTYIAYDIAYHLNKKKRGFNSQITVVGADHKDHMIFLSSILKFLGIDFNVIEVANVSFLKEGKFVQFSKREGNIILLKDILENIDHQHLRIDMISKNCTSPITIERNEMRENQFLFYLQYAYARICSIQNKIKEYPSFYETDYKSLETDLEESLFQKMLWWEYIVENSIRTLEVNKIYVYLLDLAKLVHEYLSKQKILTFDLKMWDRIKLLEKIGIIIKDGGIILGIELKEIMGVKSIVEE